MTDQSLLEYTLQKRRLRWFGHVERIKNASHARQALHWIPTETGKSGRPRITWRDRIMKDECDVGWNLLKQKWTGRSGENGLPNVLATGRTKVLRYICHPLAYKL